MKKSAKILSCMLVGFTILGICIIRNNCSLASDDFNEEEVCRLNRVVNYQNLDENIDDNLFEKDYVDIEKEDIEKVEEVQEEYTKVDNRYFLNGKYIATTGADSLKSKYSNNTKLLSLYNEIKDVIIKFYNSSTDVKISNQINSSSGDYIYGTVDYKDNGLSSSEASMVYYTLKDDMPYYYFMSCILYYDANKLYFVLDKNYASYNDRTQYYKMIDNKVKEYKNLTDNFSKKYEKVLAVHDKMIREVDYTDEEEYDGYKEESHNIVGVLGKYDADAVCQGYAMAANLIYNYIGVDCVFVSGKGIIGTTSGGHAWNEVKLDDNKWYGLDITWDDQPENKGGIIYNFYGAKNVDFSSSHIIDRNGKYSGVCNKDIPTLATNNCPYSYSEVIKDVGEFEENGVLYKTKGMYAYVTGYEGELNTLTIPQIVNNKMVVAIENGAFTNNTNLKKVTLDESIIYIDGTSDINKGAFANCSNLEEVVLKDYVNYIGRYSFYNCTKLSKCNYPIKLANLDSYAFYNCPCKNNMTSKKTDINNNIQISGFKTKLTYTGKILKQNISITVDGKKLSENEDYTIYYKNNTAIGTATMTIEGIGKYVGKIEKTFTIIPPTVKNISLSARGTNYLTLKWSAISGVSGYRIERYNDKTKSFAFVKNVSTNTYKDINLSSAKVYTYRIQAYKGSIKGAYSSNYSNITLPKKAKSVKISSKNKKVIKIAVSKADSPTYYKLYRKDGANGKYKCIKNLTLKSLVYDDSKLRSGKYYYYKVRAYKKSGNNEAYGSYTSAISIKCK